MKRTRTNKPKVDLANFAFNKETNRLPFVPVLGIYKGELFEIVRGKDIKGEIKIQSIGASEYQTVKETYISIPKKTLMEIWEFVYNRKWYIENHYVAGDKVIALFELNLYLKHIEKLILKKYGST